MSSISYSSAAQDKIVSLPTPNLCLVYFHFTMAALEDELVRLLSSNGTATFHPYLQQAEEHLYKINASQPVPKFTIFFEDVPEGLSRELQSLGKSEMNKVITNAVRRLYESVDPEYYHTNGIYGKVKWETAKK